MLFQQCIGAQVIPDDMHGMPFRLKGGFILQQTTDNNDKNQEDSSSDKKSTKNIGKKSIIFLLTIKTSVAYLNNHCTLRQGIEKMRHHMYTAMPVVSDDGTYIGTVSEGDFLWHIVDSGVSSIKVQEDYPITEILRKGWNPAVKINTTIDELLLRVMEQNFVPVVDDRDKFMGIITRKSVIKYYHELFITGENGNI